MNKEDLAKLIASVLMQKDAKIQVHHIDDIESILKKRQNDSDYELTPNMVKQFSKDAELGLNEDEISKCPMLALFKINVALNSKIDALEEELNFLKSFDRNQPIKT